MYMGTSKTMRYISEQAEKEIIKRYSPKRYAHVQNVMELAVKLAEKHGVDRNKAYVAALLHDIAKDMDIKKMVAMIELSGISIDQEYHNNNILHGPCGSVIAFEDYGVEDEEILYAIYYHTFGRVDMSMLEKVIFISDAAEKDRMYKDVELVRKVMFSDLNAAVEISLSGTVSHVLAKGEILFPLTAIALEYYKELREKE